MGDQAEAGRMLKQMAAERRRNRLDLNWSVLDECGIPFEERASSVLFREPGKPKCDFYPGTGRWRVAGDTRTYRGGARKFLDWYRAQCADKGGEYGRF